MQKTADERRISDGSSDVCSSDLSNVQPYRTFAGIERVRQIKAYHADRLAIAQAGTDTEMQARRGIRGHVAAIDEFGDPPVAPHAGFQLGTERGQEVAANYRTVRVLRADRLDRKNTRLNSRH